jgi:hypothetical protein
MRTITPSALVGMSRRELGELFRAGTVPGIPDGQGRGAMLLGTGGRLSRLAAALCYALAWRGKVVDAKAGRLTNILTPLAVRAVQADVYEAPSRYDQKPCIVLDYSRRSFVARTVRDEIREVSPGLYLGLVFWRRRHVLDFSLDFTRHP